MRRMAKQLLANYDNSVNGTSLERLGTLFLQSKVIAGIADSTLTYYNDAFRYLRNTGFPDDLAKLTTADIEAYIAQLLNNGMKPITVNTKLRYMKALINWAHEREYIATNPIKPVKFLKHEKTIIRTFDPRDIRAMLNECADGSFVGIRDHAMILLMLDTGVRASEMLGTTIPELDVERNVLIVMGKGRKARRVFYSDTTSRALQMYLTERGVLKHEYVWVADDNEPYKLRSFQDRLKDLAQRGGITGIRVSPHTFRHTFAKMYIQNGGDIFTLQKMLGHTTLDMVRNYVEMFSEEVAEAHERFSPVKNMR